MCVCGVCVCVCCSDLANHAIGICPSLYRCSQLFVCPHVCLSVHYTSQLLLISLSLSQVHPVNGTQEAPPHKGFNVQQMMIEHSRSLSTTSDPNSDSAFSSELRPQQKRPKPRPLSSPHPNRARTQSSPNPALRRGAAVKLKGQGVESVEKRRVSGDSVVHPDKRFSTGIYLLLCSYCVSMQNIIRVSIDRTNRLDVEARCLRKIETRGAVECGVPSAARALPTCPEGFNFM